MSDLTPAGRDRVYANSSAVSPSRVLPGRTRCPAGGGRDPVYTNSSAVSAGETGREGRTSEPVINVVTECAANVSPHPTRAGLAVLRGEAAQAAAVLVTDAHRYERDDQGGDALAALKTPLADEIELNRDGRPVRAVIDRCLLPAVVEAGRRLGTGIVVARGCGPAGLGLPSGEGGPTGLTPSVRDVLVRYGSGIVRCGPGVDRVVLAASIASSYPDRTVTVLCRSKAQARDAAAACVSAGLRPFRLYSRGPLPQGARLVVTTTGQLSRVPAADLVVTLDPRGALRSHGPVSTDSPLDRPAGFDSDRFTAGGRRHLLSVGATAGELDHADPGLRAGLPRRLALIDLDEAFSDNEAARLGRLFGFAEATLFAEGHVPTRVTVETIVLRRRPGGYPGGDAGTRFLRGIVRNAVRNRVAAKVAREKAAEGHSVRVLAAGPAHAAALARMLPGWAARVAAGADVGGLAPADRRCLHDALRLAGGPGLIVTPAALRTLDPDAADVIVRADGGRGLPLGLAVPTGSVPGRAVRLVDFDDRFDPLLRRSSRQRFAAYRGAGWFAEGADPVAERAKDFVDRAFGGTARVE